MEVGKPIQMRDSAGGTVFRQNGEKLDRSYMVRRLRRQDESKPYIRRSRTYKAVGVVLAAAGGFLVGVPIGQAIAGDPSPRWVLAGVGGGVIVSAFPFGFASSSALKTAVRKYNMGLELSPPPNPPTPQIVLPHVRGGSQLSLSVSF